MPRRKRKKSATQRKPLIFTESPTNCSYANLPSPVRCASHPATADVVPVEDLGDLTWVSPQFHGQPASCRRRGKRQSRTREQDKENLHSMLGPRTTLPRGFVPLRLQGEERTEISDIQDVSEEVNIDLLDSPQHQADFEEEDLNTSSNQTPVTVQQLRDTNVNRLGHAAVHNDTDRPRGENNTDSPDHPTNCRQSLDWSALSSTQTRQHPDLFPKVLFPLNTSQNVDNSVRHDSQVCHGTVEQVSVRTSTRIRENYHQAVGLFRTPVRTSDSRTSYKVLVVDTPECEYGLSLKDRRLKALKLRMNMLK